MVKNDHGIVIAGETSAGKSTLVNKILGIRIFKARNHESTSTICKIRDSKKVKIVAESKTGDLIEKDLSKKCNIATEEGVKMLRDILKDFTDLTSSHSSKDFRSVDIGFPISFLKKNTILVDTPGIGGSGEFTPKLKEYLPNALSFVFVINAGSAGGMQKDKASRNIEGPHLPSN
uniref:Uncharacterized protein LOC111117885 isoform X2 n=1 Tax=Crassostrea virginica TaxID=6565 RepID=A0A8B8CDZ3_CRAVI|nr:uncharacterized protein LOC111117885 isoform X2 [Crassostrea virginica]